VAAPPWVSELGSTASVAPESLPSLSASFEPAPPGGAWTATLADALLVRTPSRSSVTLVMPGEWVPLGGTVRPVSSQQSMEEALRDSWAAKEEELDELELESTELEPIGFDPAAGPQDKLDSEVTERSHPAPTLRTPSHPVHAKRRRDLAGAGLKSPTLRAVRETLRRGGPSSGSSAEPEGAPPIRRVFLQLDEPSLVEASSPQTELGEDSVWLEFGEPGLAEEITERESPDGRGGRTADVVAAGGAVRVDLSLGTKEAPDLEQRRRSVEEPAGSPARPTDIGAESSEPFDLLTYSGGPLEGDVARKLEDEATERGPGWEEP